MFTPLNFKIESLYRHTLAVYIVYGVIKLIAL